MTRRLSFAGLIGASLAAAMSMTPSLVPRAALIQGLLTGVLAALGYGLGATAGWSLRAARHRPDWQAGKVLHTGAWLSGTLLVAIATVAGRSWQTTLSAVAGVSPPGWSWPGTAAVTALGVFGCLLVIARAVRWAVGRLARSAQRVAGPRVATGAAVTFSLLVGVVLVDRIPETTVSLFSGVFARMNESNPAGVQPPTSPVVSGGPRSAVPWDDLGSQGRAFVAGATPVAQLEEFSGRPARDPVRVFVGIDSADTATDRATLAVAELERFGAFARQVIAVGTSAGSGTVDPGEVAPLEYLFDGDVATVSTQYSTLPSFLSFVVDRSTSVQESRTLLAAVRARLDRIPEARRPRLVVFGESLGAYGASGAFSDLPDLLARTDGAMFQGPPNATALWRRYTDERAAGTPERLPVFDRGRHLRWADTTADLASPPLPFIAPRVVFLQNASDPVVWWSPSLMWSRPDWLTEPRGPGVLNWPWLPVVTFAGLTGDLINSQGVPPGHGHVYGTDPVSAWADILRPPDWSAADTARLRRHLEGG